MKLSKDQKDLLIILKESFERGSASISCGQRMKAAKELTKMGFAEEYGFGYRINKAGMIALIKEAK